jgi:endonuclease IV
MKGAREINEVGMTAFQVFPGNPMGYYASEPAKEKFADKFYHEVFELSNEGRMGFVHSPYFNQLTMHNENGKHKWEQSVNGLISQLRWAEAFGLEGVVVHPGSPKGRPLEDALDEVINSAMTITQGHDSPHAKLYLENSAGKGVVGTSINDLVWICMKVNQRSDWATPVRVCIDTTHAWAAGYTVEEICDLSAESVIELVHFNQPNHDIKRGSHRDSHKVAVDDGAISAEEMEMIAYAWKDRPFVIEGSPDKEHDIRKVREWVSE